MKTTTKSNQIPTPLLNKLESTCAYVIILPVSEDNMLFLVGKKRYIYIYIIIKSKYKNLKQTRNFINKT